MVSNKEFKAFMRRDKMTERTRVDDIAKVIHTDGGWHIEGFYITKEGAMRIYCEPTLAVFKVFVGDYCYTQHMEGDFSDAESRSMKMRATKFLRKTLKKREEGVW